MKTKKQKVPSASNNKKQQKDHELIPPLGKQFQLLYRTCDKLPSSQQYQSVFFLKRKKISGEDQASSQQKKTKKKKVNTKKKKIEENQYIDDICDGLCKKNQSLSITKSTMPSSTLGMFKKSTFVDTFKENIDLERSSIKKINNLSNSNSSRILPSKYINKEQKSQKKKIVSPSMKQTAKSPGKQPITVSNNIQSFNKILEQNHSKSTKTIKTIKQKEKKVVNTKKIEKQTPKIINKNKKEIKATKKTDNSIEDHQYVFLDGEYLQVQNVQNEALTEKIISIYRSEAENQDKNQFIEGFGKVKRNLEKKSSIQNKYLTGLSQQQQQITQTENAQAQKQILSKIIFIQRWWRSHLENRVIQQCNNIKHFPSNAESQRQLSENLYSQHQESDFEDSQNELDVKITQGESNMINFLEMREKLIFTHMQSEKDILNKMLELKKIDSTKYTNSLMEIQSNFQLEMLDIKKFKQKVVVEAERMQELKVKLKEKSQIINKLQKLPANVILEHFIEKPIKPHTSPQASPPPHLISKNQPFNRQKSTGCHYSQLSEENEDKIHTIYGKNSIKTYENNQIKSPLNIVEKQGEKEKFVHSQSEDDEQDNKNQEKEEDDGADSSKLELQLEGAIDRQMAQAEIEKRYASQLGIGFQYGGLNKNSISTSVISIHNFLMNFLKFYEYFYKDEFLKMINLPYGLNQRSRMKLHQNYSQENWQSLEIQDEQLFFKVESIIRDEVLEDFHEHNYQLPEDIDDQTRAILFFQKIHQKAIIDCFNQSLNCFRPYYFIGGAPYIWNYSQKALTFYYIAEQNIQQVFQKTQYKVLKTASSLCGVLAQPLISIPDIKPQMSLSQKLIKYRQSADPLLVQNREQKLGKVQKIQIQQYNFKWQYFEQEKTCIKFDIAQLIYEELLLQLLEIKPLGNKIQTNQYEIMSRQGSQKQVSSTSDIKQVSSQESSYSINQSVETCKNVRVSQKQDNSNQQQQQQQQEEQQQQEQEQEQQSGQQQRQDELKQQRQDGQQEQQQQAQGQQEQQQQDGQQDGQQQF